jgi:hypothetical protein
LLKKTLVEEILENARKDRIRIENLLEKMLKVSSVPGVEDDLAQVAVAEQVADLTDSLTKMNQQLVELVKVQSKNKEEEPKEGTLSKKEREAAFDEIEDPPQDVTEEELKERDDE